MTTELPVCIEQDVMPSLMRYCATNDLGEFTLVADSNTYPALGEAVEEALAGRGFDVKTIILTGEEVIADAHYVMQVLVGAGREDRTYLAVGSGTITDIVRFVSHRTKASFISVPTAPSVDGFTSSGAPLVVGGFKQTVYTHAPVAVFADLDTLCSAPRGMIAAGFGDILGKYTALADWKLGHLLWDEAYDERIAQRVRAALQNCVDQADQIGAASTEGVRFLIDALIDSGLCILDFGRSHPASQSEHHLSHFWEMKLLLENRPAVLHGAKVGVACTLMARVYEKIRELSREQAGELLQTSTLPDRAQEEGQIRAIYGEMAGQVIAQQAPYLDMSEDAYDQLKQRIVDRWADVQDIAALVPPSQKLVDLLRQVGGPADTQALGLQADDVALALEYSHYIRDRFTVAKLSRILGILEPSLLE